VEELAESLRIDRLTAEFYYPETEGDFRLYVHESRIRDTRLAIALSAVFYLAFAISDYLVMQGSGDYLVVLTLRVAVCSIGIAAVLLSKRYWRHLVNGMIPTFVVGFALAAFLGSMTLVPLQYGVHGMGMMIMLLGVYVFIPNRFVLALATACVASVVFAVLLSALFKLTAGEAATLTAMLTVINVLGAMTSYRLSQMMREEYRDQAIVRMSHRKLKIEMDERLRLEDVLRQRAEVDDVTGVANRRVLFERAEEMLAAANAGAGPLSVLLLDVDYFRQINGTYGHLRSDEVLKALVSVCNSLLGKGQYLARLGGEEFIVLLPGSDSREAVDTAERIRAECQRTPVAMDDVIVHFTISVGVAQYRPGDSFHVTLRRADEATAVAKYKGRNRVEVAE
jgi:diguanylate cyclase (GGDEF)-like protein